MVYIVDARGLACPQPVLLTKKAFEEYEGEKIVTIVDNKSARENVERMARSLGCKVDVEMKDGDYYLNIIKDFGQADNYPDKTSELFCKRFSVAEGILICSEFLGRGNDELGKVLMRSFFYTLSEAEPVPRELIFVNSGVKLTCEGSPVLQSLEKLCERGVEIYSCGTCLDYLGIKDRLQIGSVTNMYDIVSRVTGGRIVAL